MSEWGGEWEERYKIKKTVCPTGNAWLDDGWAGGLNKEQLVLVGAKTGIGKTHFGVQLAISASRAQKKVFYFALEASPFEIERRRLYFELHKIVREELPGEQMPRFREWLHQEFDERWKKIEDYATGRIDKECSSLDVKYRTTAYSPEEFEADARDLISEAPDLIILDHLHHFLLEGNEGDALKSAIRTIDRLKNELEIPIVVLAQVRKTDGKSAKTSLSKLEDIRGTAALTDIATDVLIISRVPEEFQKQIPGGLFNPTFIHAGKSRTTPEMIHYVAVVGFDFKTGEYQSWYQLAQNRDFEDPHRLTTSELPLWAKRSKHTMEASEITQSSRKDHDD